MKRFAALPVAALIAITSATAAIGAVTFNSETGEGFVGKGDVQLAFDWNNKQLQENARAVRFQVNSGTSTTWVCVRANGNENPRHNTTTLSGVLTEVLRENSKGKAGAVTGFALSGYDEDNVITRTSGHPLESCPSGGTFDPDSVETTSLGGGLEISGDHGETFVPFG